MGAPLNPVAVCNWVNLSTPLGLGLARAAGCRIERREGLHLATGYRHRLPVAGAFTVGSVVVFRGPVREELLDHEAAHARQYCWWGLLLPPAYGVCALVSLALAGDWWSENPFERRAGLEAGGYLRRRRRFGSGRGR